MSTKPRELVVAERTGAVLTITLNRPEKSNALHPDLLERLANIVSQVRDDPRVNAVVLTGAGRSFCAGLDLELLAEWSSVQKMEYLAEEIALFRSIWEAPQPYIAAVNGPAIAGGLDLAAFCDIRLAAREAQFGQAEINVGLVPVVHPLYKMIGLARAKELAMTGRYIDAAEAYRIGLVNHVYPADELMDRAMEMAATLASKPRHALFETKRMTRELIDLDTADALDRLEAVFCRCLNDDEHHEELGPYIQSLHEHRRR